MRNSTKGNWRTLKTLMGVWEEDHGLHGAKGSMEGNRLRWLRLRQKSLRILRIGIESCSYLEELYQGQEGLTNEIGLMHCIFDDECLGYQMRCLIILNP